MSNYVLVSNKALYSPSGGLSDLQTLLAYMGIYPDNVTVENLEDAATRLSRIARKDPPWTWRYIHQALYGKVAVSKRLADAIMRLGAVFDDVPEDISACEDVLIKAKGNVRPGALVLKDSRPCANPDCQIDFVPGHPLQRYHDAKCRLGRGST